MTEKYDYVIIGSGFGGSVSALRLCEKGYKVLLIEKGKWYGKDDFPETNWNLKKWLWLPSLRFFGIMKMTFYKHVSIISGVGVGGGSLVYANTLPTPKPAFYKTGSWKTLEDWENTLKPHYETALRMLGAAPNPHLELGDKLLQQLAVQQGRGEHFEAARVSVFFGEAEKTVPDPYFNGEGPERSGCNICGGCMTGCRYNAKNSLDKNYLHLALNKGLKIVAENEVTGVKPIGGIPDGSKGYEITYNNAISFFKKGKTKIRAKGVIFSGGVLGTVKLLLQLKRTTLPRLSERVGDDVRTNNESLIFSVTTDKEADLTKGIAIGSVYHADEHSHLEPVRYGRGSGFWRLMMVPVVSGGNFFSRMLQISGKILRHPLTYFRLLTVKDFSKQSIVLLFMQHLDSTLNFRRGIFRMKTRVSKGSRPKAQIPFAARLAEKYGKLTGGKSFVILTESVLNMPSTAHILGGAVMGESAEKGVIDKNNCVFGYKNMMVCDGSTVSANPGVNPSLTITALTERAMDKIAKKN